MNQQIVIIHGGTTFETYKDYLSFLKNRGVDLDNFTMGSDWKGTLEEKLGKNFQILFPSMPNKTNARYKEWKIWFERMFPFLRNNTILIGHSLGGIFLAKYLSENKLPKKIKATILVATPFDAANSVESLGDFKLSTSLAKFAKQGGIIYLIQSKDDPAVPFEEFEKYQKVLPEAKSMLFDGRGHFNQESFPEIISLIKTL